MTAVPDPTGEVGVTTTERTAVTETETSRRSPDYWMGAGAAERHRLLAPAQAHRPQAEELLDRLAPPAGSAAVDLGCGPIGILDLLAERLGPDGRVVGVDIEQPMLDVAEVSLAERGLSGVRLLRADIAGTDLAPGSFDLVHGRLVLLNDPQPGRIVDEMVRLARPGGTVAVQDLDKRAWTCEPAHPAWDRVMAGFQAAQSAAGLDEYIGRRLPRILREAGLTDIETALHARMWTAPDASNRAKLVHFATVGRAPILATEVYSGPGGEARFDADLRELTEHLARPDTVVVNALLVQAWGRLPP